MLRVTGDVHYSSDVYTSLLTRSRNIKNAQLEKKLKVTAKTCSRNVAQSSSENLREPMSALKPGEKVHAFAAYTKDEPLKAFEYVYPFLRGKRSFLDDLPERFYPPSSVLNTAKSHFFP